MEEKEYELDIKIAFLGSDESDRYRMIHEFFKCAYYYLLIPESI